MSYSDYGGLAWRNFEPAPELIDCTLTGIVAPKNKPLERLTGLKLDVLLNACKETGRNYIDAEQYQQSSVDDWIANHPHHVILGTMKGLALVGHKQSVLVCLNGVEILRFPDYDNDEFAINMQVGPTELLGFVYALRVVKYQHSFGVAMYLKTPDGDILTGITGYGIGEQWWKNDDGTECICTGHRFVQQGEDSWWMWSSVAEREDCERLGVEPGDVIGIKPGIRWASDEELRAIVFEFANELALGPDASLERGFPG